VFDLPLDVEDEEDGGRIGERFGGVLGRLKRLVREATKATLGKGYEEGVEEDGDGGEVVVRRRGSEVVERIVVIERRFD